MGLGPQVSLLVKQILLCCLMGVPSPEVGLQTPGGGTQFWVYVMGWLQMHGPSRRSYTCFAQHS